MKPIGNLPPSERNEALAPFIGKRCRVTYRRIKQTPFERELVGRVVGTSYPQTNGGSSGDLVLAPTNAENNYLIGERLWQLKSIALANVGTLEVIS